MTFSLVAAAALANGFLIGLIPTIIDGLKPALQIRLNLSERGIDWYIRLFYLAWLPGMPIAGWLLDEFPNRDLLLYGGLPALILGFAWLALTRTTALAQLNAIFLGFGYSLLTTATIRLMPLAFFPDTGNEFNVAALNLGFVPVGLGAMVGPAIVKALEKWLGFRQGLLYLSIMLLVPAVLTALSDGSAFPAPVQDAASLREVMAYPQMGLIVAVILLYFALETCLEFWPDSYLREIGYEGKGLQVGLMIFWLAFVAARGAAAWLLYEHPHQAFFLTILLICLSALVLGNLAGGFEFGSGSFGFWALGVCYGPVLPALLGMALNLDLGARPLPMSAFGLLLALSGLDTLVLRPFLSVATRDFKARSVMFLPTILALIAAAVLLVLPFIPK
jgi:MFS family permease